MHLEEVLDTIEKIKKFKTETMTIEVKTAKDGFPKKCYDTISSFSNKYGGIIIFGIDEENDFKIDNVYDINDLQKQIATLCSDSMEPAVRCVFLPLEVDGKKILAVKINELPQSKKPCYYKPKGINKGAYTRVGDRDDVMTDYEIYTYRSYNEDVQEDLRPVRRASLEDLDSKKLKKYIENVKKNKPNFAKSSDERILKLSGIVDYSGNTIYPTVSGMFVFGQYPQAYFPQLFIACCAIPGTKLGVRGQMGQRFDDNLRVEGTIEEMLEGALNFLRRNMKNRVIVNPNTGFREDKTEYPMEALREAIANALVHRDYSSQMEGCYIEVYIYYDRIEIVSPGPLYGTNKVEDLGTDKKMQIRNETILKLLEENGSLIENRHTGILTMKEETKKYGLPEPIFIDERNAFRVIFRNNEGTKQVSEQVSEQVTEQVYNKINNYKNKTLEYCVEPKTAKEIRCYLNLKSRNYVSDNIIQPLIKEGTLEYTNSNLKASNQKYVTKKNK